MKKYFVTFGVLGLLTFLSLFLDFYKTTRKFRQSILAAFVAVSFYFSGMKSAHSAGSGQLEGFTTQNQHHRSRSQQREGIFGHKSNNDGSGSGKPNDDGSGGGFDSLSKYPKPESVEKTQERVDHIDERLHGLEEISDTESECKSGEQFKVDESYK